MRSASNVRSAALLEFHSSLHCFPNRNLSSLFSLNRTRVLSSGFYPNFLIVDIVTLSIINLVNPTWSDFSLSSVWSLLIIFTIAALLHVPTFTSSFLKVLIIFSVCFPAYRTAFEYFNTAVFCSKLLFQHFPDDPVLPVSHNDLFHDLNFFCSFYLILQNGHGSETMVFHSCHFVFWVMERVL